MFATTGYRSHRRTTALYYGSATKPKNYDWGTPARKLKESIKSSIEVRVYVVAVCGRRCSNRGVDA
jgi:hypothetical protein